MTMLCAAKCALMSHWSLTKSAAGVPYNVGGVSNENHYITCSEDARSDSDIARSRRH